MPKKKILIDIAHPAHVHFYKNIICQLKERRHEILILARNKDVTLLLLDSLNLQYESVGGQYSDSRLNQLAELSERVLRLYRIGKRFKPDLILTRNPAGVQAAKLLGCIGVFDTDDGRAAGIHFKSAAPFATFITSPDCLQEYYGKKHVKYPGYKQSAYLHPDVFTPDNKIKSRLLLEADEPFYLVRFVAMSASHDKGEKGIAEELKDDVIDLLQHTGKVFISSEYMLPEKWRHLMFPLSPMDLMNALAFAQLLVCDSQTMAAEAAMLGTPSIRMSSFVGRISYLEELEHRYRLTFGFHSTQSTYFMGKLQEMLNNPIIRRDFKRNYQTQCS